MRWGIMRSSVEPRPLAGSQTPQIRQPRQSCSFAGPRRWGARRGPVRSPLGRDARNSLTRMGPAPGFGRPAQRGSVWARSARAVRSAPGKLVTVLRAFSRRTGLLADLKIRVSMVRFRPWPPLPTGAFRSHGLHLIPDTWLTLCPGRRDWDRARPGPDLDRSIPDRTPGS